MRTNITTLDIILERVNCNVETAKRLARLCLANDLLLTKAQLKTLSDNAWRLEFTLASHYMPTHRAIAKALTLREPCFIEVLLTEALVGTTALEYAVSKYLQVADEQACRTVLKNADAARLLQTRLKKAMHERDMVYTYAQYHTDLPVTIDNAYKAAWYILEPDAEAHVVIGAFSTKQLKAALSNPELIDRYAMIEQRDYCTEIAYQSTALDVARAALSKHGATMHVFKDSMELANEGCRMGNCIGTYWDHDHDSCLFSVDYADEHMDVELMLLNEKYGTWEVAQVYAHANTMNEHTEFIHQVLTDALDEYNASVMPKEACTIDEIDFDVEDGDLYIEDDDCDRADFEPRFVDDDMFEDDDLAF